jgi:ATP-dependent Clp protease ATP-binding subunit ClpA
MSALTPPLAKEAAIALGIASTALPFARTPEAAIERWLRILRINGEAGSALQALGMSEDRVQEVDEARRSEATEADRGARPRLGGGEVADVERVGERAAAIARQLGDETITTKHLLLAVMRIDERELDRALQAHGCYRDDLVERLGVSLASC